MRVAYIVNNVGRFYSESVYVTSDDQGLLTYGQNHPNCKSDEDAALLFHQDYPDGEIKSKAEVMAVIEGNNKNKAAEIARTSKTYKAAMKRCNFRCSSYLRDAWDRRSANEVMPA